MQSNETIILQSSFSGAISAELSRYRSEARAKNRLIIQRNLRNIIFFMLRFHLANQSTERRKNGNKRNKQQQEESEKNELRRTNHKPHLQQEILNRP